MKPRKTPLDGEQRAKALAELRRDVALRQQSYRERAMNLFPHICARCGREFSGKRLRELTVHHKDHNHDNNPPDGSNWELLCLYCHDNEHEKYLMAGHGGDDSPAVGPLAPSIFKPFENLESVLKPHEPDEGKGETA
jgi:hypothetical protein